MRARPAALAAVLAVLALAPAAQAADPRRGEQWGLDLVEAEAARSVSTGAGAVVAVLDTGADLDHPDLRGRLLAGYDFHDDDDRPEDDEGHGSHVAGIVAATTDNGVGVASVAPGARILPVRVLGRDGGFLDDVADGIDFAIRRRVQVINLSLGEDLPLSSVGVDTGFGQALRRATDAGILVVAAGGNDGLPFCQQPASERGRILCVGAVDRERRLTFYSSFGGGLDLVAPGGAGDPDAPQDDILSTSLNGGYEFIAGTSQATPHVAGVGALLAARGVKGARARERLLATAVPTGDLGSGAGLVNARRALAGLGPGGGGGGGGGGGSGGGDDGAGDGGGGSGRATVTASRSVRRATLLRRGLAVRCRGTADGRCTVRLLAGRRQVARRQVRVTAGRTRAFRVRLSRRGRAVVRDGVRTLRLRATVPGRRGVARRVRVRG